MADRITDLLEDPDNVGEATYITVYEQVMDAIQTAHLGDEDEAGVLELVLEELENLQAWAKSVHTILTQLGHTATTDNTEPS